MSNRNQIDININKAKLISFWVNLKDDSPEVSATIGLYVGDKKITDFSISTETWRDNHFDLPINLIPPIKQIMSELEVILIQKCNQSLNLLGDGNA